jgi:hypothetical protein
MEIATTTPTSSHATRPERGVTGVGVSPSPLGTCPRGETESGVGRADDSSDRRLARLSASKMTLIRPPLSRRVRPARGLHEAALA